MVYENEFQQVTDARNKLNEERMKVSAFKEQLRGVEYPTKRTVAITPRKAREERRQYIAEGHKAIGEAEADFSNYETNILNPYESQILTAKSQYSQAESEYGLTQTAFQAIRNGEPISETDHSPLANRMRELREQGVTSISQDVLEKNQYLVLMRDLDNQIRTLGLAPIYSGNKITGVAGDIGKGNQSWSIDAFNKEIDKLNKSYGNVSKPSLYDLTSPLLGNIPNQALFARIPPINKLPIPLQEHMADTSIQGKAKMLAQTTYQKALQDKREAWDWSLTNIYPLEKLKQYYKEPTSITISGKKISIPHAHIGLSATGDKDFPFTPKLTFSNKPNIFEKTFSEFIPTTPLDLALTGGLWFFGGKILTSSKPMIRNLQYPLEAYLGYTGTKQVITGKTSEEKIAGALTVALAGGMAIKGLKTEKNIRIKQEFEKNLPIKYFDEENVRIITSDKKGIDLLTGELKTKFANYEVSSKLPWTLTPEGNFIINEGKVSITSITKRLLRSPKVETSVFEVGARGQTFKNVNAVQEQLVSDPLLDSLIRKTSIELSGTRGSAGKYYKRMIGKGEGNINVYWSPDLLGEIQYRGRINLNSQPITPEELLYKPFSGIGKERIVNKKRYIDFMNTEPLAIREYTTGERTLKISKNPKAVGTVRVVDLRKYNKKSSLNEPIESFLYNSGRITRAEYEKLPYAEKLLFDKSKIIEPKSSSKTYKDWRVKSEAKKPVTSLDIINNGLVGEKLPIETIKPEKYMESIPSKEQLKIKKTQKSNMEYDLFGNVIEEGSIFSSKYKKKEIFSNFKGKRESMFEGINFGSNPFEDMTGQGKIQSLSNTGKIKNLGVMEGRIPVFDFANDLRNMLPETKPTSVILIKSSKTNKNIPNAKSQPATTLSNAIISKLANVPQTKQISVNRNKEVEKNLPYQTELPRLKQNQIEKLQQKQKQRQQQKQKQLNPFEFSDFNFNFNSTRLLGLPYDEFGQGEFWEGKKNKRKKFKKRSFTLTPTGTQQVYRVRRTTPLNILNITGFEIARI